MGKFPVPLLRSNDVVRTTISSDEVGLAVFVEVYHRHRPGSGSIDAKAADRGEIAVSIVEEYRHIVIRLIRSGDVVLAVAVEVSPRSAEGAAIDGEVGRRLEVSGIYRAPV